MNPFSGNNPSSNPEENHGLTPADAAWLARVFTKGRGSPRARRNRAG